MHNLQAGLKIVLCRGNCQSFRLIRIEYLKLVNCSTTHVHIQKNKRNVLHFLGIPSMHGATRKIENWEKDTYSNLPLLPFVFLVDPIYSLIKMRRLSMTDSGGFDSWC
jgi:hypothetical protein